MCNSVYEANKGPITKQGSGSASVALRKKLHASSVMIANNLDCRLGGVSRRFFRSLALPFNLKSENQGRKRALVASAMPPLKRRPSGFCCRFGRASVFAFKTESEKRKDAAYASYCPGASSACGSSRFCFVRPGRSRWSFSRFRCRLPGS